MDNRFRVFRKPIQELINLTEIIRKTLDNIYFTMIKRVLLIWILSHSVYGQRVIGYYPQWIQGSFGPDEINYSVITHVLHAFAWPDGEGNIITYSDMLDPEINSTVHEYGASILLSFGGWGNSDGFPGMVSSTETRQNFINGLLDIFNAYGYDGIDLDWEFPSTTTETNDFTLLVEELRSAFDASGQDYLITMAVGPSNWTGQHFDYEALTAKIDWYSMMGYDFHGSWSSHAGHNAPLYSSPPGDPDGSVYTGINYLVNSRNIPSEKLNLGVPFYGKQFNTGEINGSFSGDVLDIRYSDVLSLIDAGWEYHWDDVAKCPYLQNNDHDVLVTFDDPQSIQEKSQYAIERELGGMMIWALGYDVSGNSQDLVESIGQHFLHNYTVPYSLLPDNVVLYDNFPNPFNPMTVIRYALPEDAPVNITIYDVMGRRVKTIINNTQTAGYNRSIHWNATNDAGSPVSAGLYLYTIEAGDPSASSGHSFRQTKKMVLLK